MSNLELVRNKKLGDLLGGNDSGWNDAWGEEEIHSHLMPRVRPGDMVLDLGSGWGRASFPLAMKGAMVVAVDCSREQAASCREAYTETGLGQQLIGIVEIGAREFCLTTPARFRFVVASSLLVHIPKTQGLGTVTAMTRTVERSGGLLMVTAPSVLSGEYETNQRYNDQVVDRDTFLEICDCSGKPRLEPIAFYWPGEIEAAMQREGGRIVLAEARELCYRGEFRWTAIAEF